MNGSPEFVTTKVKTVRVYVSAIDMTCTDYPILFINNIEAEEMHAVHLFFFKKNSFSDEMLENG